MEQIRAKGKLGGSSCAAAAGLSPWVTPLQLWERLVGETSPFEGNRFTRWGKRLEPIVIQRYCEGHRAAVHTPDSSICHGNGWARATPDGLVARWEGVDSQPEAPWHHGLEVKTADARAAGRWGSRGRSKFPEEYRAQCAWYCWVTGLDRWDLAVLIGGNDYREYTYTRDLEYENLLVDKCRTFWHHNVVGRVQPQPVLVGDHARWPTGDEVAERIDQISALRLGEHHLGKSRRELEAELGQWLERDAVRADCLDVIEAFGG